MRLVTNGIHFEYYIELAPQNLDFVSKYSHIARYLKKKKKQNKKENLNWFMFIPTTTQNVGIMLKKVSDFEVFLYFDCKMFTRKLTSTLPFPDVLDTL